MNAKRLLLPILGVIALFLLVACGGTGSAETPVEVTRVVTETTIEETISEGEPTLPPLPTPTAGPTRQPEPIQATAVPAATLPPTPLQQATQTALASETTTNTPYTDTREDHLSTFAVDVDTGAYTMMRQYVQAGRLPPAESVRVEEYVNFFDYEYSPPTDTTFAIYADGAPSPFHNDGSQILRVGIQGYDIPTEQRQPVALTFVIDTSGSMSDPNKLGLVKQSLQLLVEQLRPDDTVSIVTYGSNARIVLEPISGRNQTTILSAIDDLRSGGSTNAEAGLVLGYQMANQGFRSDGTNRVILCSDGVANVGATTAEAILERIRQEAEGGITLTTVGVGMGTYNDQLMEQLADNGQGQYAYVDTLMEARQLFVTDLMGTIQTIALDAKVQVDFNPEVVTGYHLLGYENRDVADQDFRNDKVDAGEIGAGHAVTALYAVQLAPEGNGRIATVQLRWQDPDSYLVQEINHNINTWDIAPSFGVTADHYQLAVVVAHFAELLRGSAWTNNVTFAELHDQAVQLAERLPDEPEIAEFANLIVWTAQASGTSIANAQIMPVNWGSIMEGETAVLTQPSTPNTSTVSDNATLSISSLVIYMAERVADSLTLLVVITAGVWATIMVVIIKRKWGKRLFPQPTSTSNAPSPSQEAKAQIARARQYQHQVRALVAKQAKSPYTEQLRAMAAEFERWNAHLSLLVKRLADFENNALLQQDFETVPQIIDKLTAQIEAESNEVIRSQLETTLVGYQEQQKQLEQLLTLMRRTQLRLDNTIAAMGTIYSQFQLLVAMDIDSGQAQRLSYSINEEVLQLNDLLTAVDEVSQLRSLFTNPAYG